MEEISTKCIILNTSDFGEADKIASAFSLEFGKISIKFNGVRKQKAKLKFLIQPFSYIDIECLKRGDFYVAKTGALLDNFPKIVSNFSKTICAYIIMEIISKVMPKNKVEPELFLETIEALEALEHENEYRVVIGFIVNFFEILGENLTLDINSNRVYLDLNLGNFSHEKTINSIEVDKRCYLALSTFSENESTNKMALKMLNNIFKAKYDIEINSFSFL